MKCIQIRGPNKADDCKSKTKAFDWSKKWSRTHQNKTRPSTDTEIRLINEFISRKSADWTHPMCFHRQKSTSDIPSKKEKQNSIGKNALWMRLHEYLTWVNWNVCNVTSSHSDLPYNERIVENVCCVLVRTPVSFMVWHVRFISLLLTSFDSFSEIFFCAKCTMAVGFGIKCVYNLWFVKHFKLICLPKVNIQRSLEF